jgi:hypothetical protein
MIYSHLRRIASRRARPVASRKASPLRVTESMRSRIRSPMKRPTCLSSAFLARLTVMPVVPEWASSISTRGPEKPHQAHAAACPATRLPNRLLQRLTFWQSEAAEYELQRDQPFREAWHGRPVLPQTLTLAVRAHEKTAEGSSLPEKPHRRSTFLPE